MKNTLNIFLSLVFTLFISSVAMSQTAYNYDAAWKKVETAMKSGKPKTALEEIEKLQIQAKKDQNEPQQVKAVIFKARAIQQFEEDSQLKNIQAFEKEISTAKEPVKQLLYNLTAGLYKNYFENQRWKIYNRTTTDNTDPGKPETWSIADFNNRISLYYEKSLTNPGLLQKTELKKYDPIIIVGNMRHLRPTLYDLLAHEALAYWKSDESEITKPAYAFVPDYASLAPFKIFLRQEYASKDSSSHTLKAIRLYQDLLRFHMNNEKSDALIDIDVARIQFAYENVEMPEKGQFYKEALEHIYTQYPKNEQAMQAGYLLAKWWNTKGDIYDPATGTKQDKMAYAIALDYAENVAKAFPKSEGGMAATKLMDEIKHSLLNLTLEKANVINKPFRVLLEFKNVQTVYFRMVKLKETTLEERRGYESDEEYWRRITALEPIKTWQQTVPKFKDYRQHAAEIKADGLPYGRYLLVASANSSFTTDKNPMASAEFFVSNISYVQSGEHYFVLNRDNGQPIDGAKVQVWMSNYEYDQRRNVMSKKELLTTDKNGYVTIKSGMADNRYYGNMRLEISTKNDYLFMDDNLYRTYDGYNQNQKSASDYERDNARYYFFTDRSIYRPGQSVFFKAIGLTKEAGNGFAKLFKNGSVEVILRNANYEKVASQVLTPNEYASVHGNFLLPSSGLTGTFQLELKSGAQTWTSSIQVEEYKRPKFFVEYKPITGTYKLNREITITGAAKGYAGNNIDGAQVAYRVYRTTRFMYPWRFAYGRGGIWPPIGRGEEMEITNGTTITKADGTFDITFTAIPDLSIDPKLDPSFTYTIEAVVTDINGEVRDAETAVSVGYKALLINLQTGSGLMHPADSTLHFKVTTTNLNGEAEASSVNLVITALNSPGRLLRSRQWDTPDTFVMSKQEFTKLFPNDPFENEYDYRNWDEGKVVINTKLTTPDEGSYSIKPGTLAPGYYKVEAAGKDNEGQEVKAVEYIAIFNTKNGQLPGAAYIMDYTQKSIIEPGEKAIFWHGTTLPDGFVIQQTLRKATGGAIATEKAKSTFDYIRAQKGYQVFSFDAKEEDRGGFAVNRIMVYHNRVYIQQWNVNVPWTNKDLTVSLETFRDKLQPGDNETWKVKISGAKGEAAAAEMLAGMYDASLDAFAPHTWQRMNPWTTNYFSERWGSGMNFMQAQGKQKSWYEKYTSFDKRYDHLMQVGYGYDDDAVGYAMRSMAAPGVEMMQQDVQLNEVVNSEGGMAMASKFSTPVIVEDYDKVFTRVELNAGTKTDKKTDLEGIQIRKNFNETAFFFPDLRTDKDGNISFSFTMPEALTQWKLQLLGHTTDARFVNASRTVVTQKELMVIPNAPRFLRQGDNMEFSVKISNLGEKELTGQAQLELLNAATMQPVDGWFKNVFPFQHFTVGAGQSTALKFPIEIPYLFNDAVVYRVVAKANGEKGETAVGDGEEMALPVLTNRLLVTESFPLNLRGADTKSFTWNRFKQLSAEAERTVGVDHHSITVEYTTNPAWYAVQSLPYLMEYPYDCAEQIWNRFYANALAGKIANSSPRIKEIFESWKNKTPDALLSNLQKNPELKSALLEETPWVLNAKNETEQKRNIGLLFDLVRMTGEAASAINKLKELQSSNGGFVWFKGGRDDRYMTQYILTGIGHLRKLDAWPDKQQQELKNIINQGLPYADARIKEEYEELIRNKVDLKKLQASSFAIQYLYMRSFYPEFPVADNAKKAVQFFTEQAKNNWTKNGKYEQGMIALAMHRGSEKGTATNILSSLTENSITHEEFGMYWREFNNPGWFWWQAPIESHALLMEAYHEIEGNVQRVDDMKTWLLKQKQTTNWKTTKATAEACYALLLRGTDWLSEENTVAITLGNYNINSANEEKVEAGTGYMKHIIAKEKINTSMGDITVKLQSAKKDNTQLSSTTSWGAIYWQYFEDLDRITPAETSVSIKKDLYVQRNTDRGPMLELLKEGISLKVGDRVKVRVEIKNDRNMEYVHLKDMRASCFEPVNVLSGYRWQGGLGYYEATKDASSNFFMGYLPRGTWVFEYELRATVAGNFSNGITTLQCMYAPEFSSHSKGMRVDVVE
jgi:hypothetical protein